MYCRSLFKKVAINRVLQTDYLYLGGSTTEFRRTFCQVSIHRNWVTSLADLLVLIPIFMGCPQATSMGSCSYSVRMYERML